MGSETGRDRAKRAGYHLAISAERRWDALRIARRAHRTPEHFRIDSYDGHGNSHRAVLRGRVLDNPEDSEAVDGESAWAAVRRTVGRFLTNELPGVPLQVRVGDVTMETTSDAEGYFEVRLGTEDEPLAGPWATGQVSLAAPYRGLSGGTASPVRLRISESDAAFGVISDIDDTILHTGAQRALAMIRQTMVGSELTRIPFEGAAALYRALVTNPGGGDNPVFYVSSSPWNLLGFLHAFLDHRGFPPGPLLLRDLLGNDVDRTHGSHKNARIDEVLELHPDLSFVLVGDSGQHDPEIYADVVARHPGRILAVYIREVRLDPGDRRVEAITDTWAHDIPFVLVADSATLARHAAGLGLITSEDADTVN
ncbi:conserved hypothetical protein [metagenome]|uniref:Phosphatidate phosphatase APP1 catalytic domain-containing protein n=1 Tax=metagenome TaxID=256318 RepID=A0A2P2BWS9_9ZZZZ